jgi:hypothetical protein
MSVFDLQDPLLAPLVRHGSRRGRVLIVHSSDELDESTDALLDVVSGLVSTDHLDLTVWLAVDGASGLLGARLRALGARVESLPLPHLLPGRRTARRFLRSLSLCIRTFASMKRRRFDLVYCVTSASRTVGAIARLAGVERVIGRSQEPWGTKDRVGLRPLAGASSALVAVSRMVLGVSGLVEGTRAVEAHYGVPHRSRDLPDVFTLAESPVEHSGPPTRDPAEFHDDLAVAS